MFKREVNIIRIKKGIKESVKDIVVVESPIDLIINSEPLVNIIMNFRNNINFLFFIIFNTSHS